MRIGFESGEAVARAFFEAWNKGDPDAIGDLFVEDADFVNVVGLWWTNKRQIRKAHEYGFRKIFQNAVVAITELKVRELTPDIHVIHTVSTLDGQTGVAGEPTQSRIAVISMVAVKAVNAGFLLASCHNTDRVDGADTHVRSAGELQSAKYERP